MGNIIIKAKQSIKIWRGKSLRLIFLLHLFCFLLDGEIFVLKAIHIDTYSIWKMLLGKYVQTTDFSF